MIRVYTDGSATTSDKPGGWAWVLLHNNQKIQQDFGRMENATNNDAELMAAIKGLEGAMDFYISNVSPGEPDVTLISDSEIILNWANGTYNFNQKDKMALYENLRSLVRKLKVKTEWVEGHSGDEYNELCDKMANAARKSVVAKETVKKNRELIFKVNVDIDKEELYNACCKAFKHAQIGIYDVGSNYWMTMFSDQLREILKDPKFYKIESEKL